MTDLIERLRHEAMHTGYKPAKPWGLLVDAADEIERLRAEVERLKEGVHLARSDEERRWVGMVDGLNAQLRAADDRYWALLKQFASATAVQPRPPILISTAPEQLHIPPGWKLVPETPTPEMPT